MRPRLGAEAQVMMVVPCLCVATCRPGQGRAASGLSPVDRLFLPRGVQALSHSSSTSLSSRSVSERSRSRSRTMLEK